LKIFLGGSGHLGVTLGNFAPIMLPFQVFFDPFTDRLFEFRLQRWVGWGVDQSGHIDFVNGLWLE
jgi:hypothetical protein